MRVRLLLAAWQGRRRMAMAANTVQGDYIGFNTGNGEKLISSQAAGLAWLGLVVA